MGCDIHWHEEIRHDGKWKLSNVQDINRNYGLFAFLANVRAWWDDERKHLAAPAPFPPRGLPADASAGVMDLWEVGEPDWHTPHWLMGAELAAVEAAYKSQFPDYKFDPWYEEDRRYVFWFDN